MESDQRGSRGSQRASSPPPREVGKLIDVVAGRDRKKEGKPAQRAAPLSSTRGGDPKPKLFRVKGGKAGAVPSDGKDAQPSSKIVI